MQAPGGLAELTAQGLAAWNDKIAQMVNESNRRAHAAVRQELGVDTPAQFVQSDDPTLQPGIVPVDWSAFPTRYAFMSQDTDELYRFLEWNSPTTPDWGRLGHEEYLEWRIVRGTSGRIVRIEMTTETSDYWRILAGYDPVTTLKLIGSFAGESMANWREVYGDAERFNPFTSLVTPEDRMAAFERMMNSSDNNGRPASPYNNGRKAITHMAMGFNTLIAAVLLAAHAAKPFGRQQGGGLRALTGSEAIATGTQSALDCRSSDPNIITKVMGLAFQRKKIALADPMGVYIEDVARDGVRMKGADGSFNPIPREWFTLSRGGAITAGGQSFSTMQRLVLEVPPGTGLTVSDLFDENGDAIVSGAQIAKLVTIALYARASADDIVQVDRISPELQNVANCTDKNSAEYAPVKHALSSFREADLPPGPQAGLLNSRAGVIV